MFNLVVLTGRLTSVPELKVTTNGKNVCSFNIAVDRGYGKNKVTDFISIVAWNGSAEFVSKYFKKGSLIGIEGSIQTRRYQDKNGNNRTAFEVVASNVKFVESKRDSAPESASFNNADVNDFADLGDASDGDLPF